MTRAQELRKLLLEVEAGEWDCSPAGMISVRIVDILAGSTGNHSLCQEITKMQHRRYLETFRKETRRNLDTYSELRKLLRRVEAGLEDEISPENVAWQIIDILVERAGNAAICERISNEHYAQTPWEYTRYRIRRNHGTHEG